MPLLLHFEATDPLFIAATFGRGRGGGVYSWGKKRVNEGILTEDLRGEGRGFQMYSVVFESPFEWCTFCKLAWNHWRRTNNLTMFVIVDWRQVSWRTMPCQGGVGGSRNLFTDWKFCQICWRKNWLHKCQISASILGVLCINNRTTIACVFLFSWRSVGFFGFLFYGRAMTSSTMFSCYPYELNHLFTVAGSCSMFCCCCFLFPFAFCKSIVVPMQIEAIYSPGGGGGGSGGPMILWKFFPATAFVQDRRRRRRMRFIVCEMQLLIVVRWWYY